LNPSDSGREICKEAIFPAGKISPALGVHAAKHDSILFSKTNADIFYAGDSFIIPFSICALLCPP